MYGSLTIRHHEAGNRLFFADEGSEQDMSLVSLGPDPARLRTETTYAADANG